MAVTVRDAIRAVVNDPKTSSDPETRAACQAVGMIRNAFAHAPLTPAWSIDPDCRDTVFEIVGVIELDSTGLDETPFRLPLGVA